MQRRLFLLLPLAMLVGCFAHGFNRAELDSRLKNASIQVNDLEIADAQALKPQLSFPCRVAVYLSPKGRDRWTAKDREAIESWAAELKKAGVVSDMFVMSELFASGSTLKEMRVAAARHGADALLVLQGDYDVDSHLGPAGVFNLTIVGGFVVPASHRDALFILQGGLVDVSNGYLYASIEAEGQGHIVRPTFVVEDKPAIDRAKQRALANFGPELLKRMRAVRDSAAVARN